jgi:hypothetical protein
MQREMVPDRDAHDDTYDARPIGPALAGADAHAYSPALTATLAAAFGASNRRALGVSVGTADGDSYDRWDAAAHRDRRRLGRRGIHRGGHRCRSVFPV